MGDRRRVRVETTAREIGLRMPDGSKIPAWRRCRSCRDDVREDELEGDLCAGCAEEEYLALLTLL